MRFKLFFAVASVFLASTAIAQDDDLLKGLDDSTSSKKEYVRASFKTTRVNNGQSLENVGAGVLDFKISHRFGLVNEGAYSLWGLDQAYMKIGLDYGVTDRFMVGMHRASFQKVYEAFGKYKLLWQTADNSMPISLLFYSNIACQTQKWQDTSRTNFFSSRLYYTNQLIIGRKFSDKLSIQLMPTLVHRNLVATKADKNDVFAIGFAGRYKFTRRLALTWEYYYLLPNQIMSPYLGNKVRNSLSLGLDIETGGHVFQLNFTNSTSMVDKGYICETTGNWLNGGIHFGFNISRVFTVVNKD